MIPMGPFQLGIFCTKVSQCCWPLLQCTACLITTALQLHWKEKKANKCWNSNLHLFTRTRLCICQSQQKPTCQDHTLYKYFYFSLFLKDLERGSSQSNRKTPGLQHICCCPLGREKAETPQTSSQEQPFPFLVPTGNQCRLLRKGLNVQPNHNDLP